ncbi:hypothetical protein GG344DRAFT_84267 [Lentinula edodes]|nr:hypothetical protein GG344DRAFT_84267 [Lentinula edodes]
MEDRGMDLTVPFSPTPKRFGNVEATPHVELRTASPLPPPTLEDVHPQAQPPGTYPPGHIPSRELTLLGPICIYDLLDPILTDLPGPPRNPLKGHHLVVPATTRSFPSSVAVLVAPFKLQPAPSTLQHKPPYTKTYPKTYFDPGLTQPFGPGTFVGYSSNLESVVGLKGKSRYVVVPAHSSSPL